MRKKTRPAKGGALSQAMMMAQYESPMGGVPKSKAAPKKKKKR